MIDLGGAIYLGGAYLLHLVFYVWYIIMHSCLLSCIELHKCDHDIYVIVISMWCDIYVICDMCALYFELFICHVTCICFASVFYSDANELYFLYSCLFHIYWVHHVGLRHISLPNSFVLIVKSLYEPSMLKTSSLLHTQSCIVINHQKGGDWKHLGP